MENKINFLLAYDSYISYLFRHVSKDWSNFNKAKHGAFSSHYSEDVVALENFVAVKFKDGLFVWFLELFLKFVHFKASDPSSDSDMLAHKVCSIVKSIISPNFVFDNNLGILDEKTIETLSEVLKQFQSRSSHNRNNQPSNNKKNSLEDVKPENFKNLTESREFIGTLFHKLARYENHLNVFNLHLNNKTTPSALFYNKFSQPFFTDIPDFVADYNKLILEFQIAVMKLIVKYLEMRVSLIKSKLIAIKQNLAMNNPNKASLDKEIDDLNESIKSSLSERFKFAIEKVNRCVSKPYVAGMRYKKRKPVVRINDDQFVSTPAASQTATPGASSLNSSTSSVNNASSYQQKSILRPPTSYNNQHRRNTYNTYNRNRSSFTNNSIFNPYNN
jgi:hypothetical protein